METLRRSPHGGSREAPRPTSRRLTVQSTYSPQVTFSRVASGP